MVTPTAAGDDDDDEDDGLDNAWDNGDDEQDDANEGEDVDETDETDDTDGFEDGAKISTSSIHEEDIDVDDEIGEINDSTSTSDLSDAEIEDEDMTSNEDDVEVSMATITEDDVDGEKFGFDETEDAEDDDEDEDGDEDGSDSGFDDLDEGGQIASDINNGVASLGVVGIEDDETQDELRDDFRRTARDFRLGYYGEECVQEYFLSDGEDEVSPVWGLVFASMVCAAIFAFRRPDTEELGEKVSDAIGNIGEGLGGESS